MGTESACQLLTRMALSTPESQTHHVIAPLGGGFDAGGRERESSHVEDPQRPAFPRSYFFLGG